MTFLLSTVNNSSASRSRNRYLYSCRSCCIHGKRRLARLRLQQKHPQTRKWGCRWTGSRCPRRLRPHPDPNTRNGFQGRWSLHRRSKSRGVRRMIHLFAMSGILRNCCSPKQRRNFQSHRNAIFWTGRLCQRSLHRSALRTLRVKKLWICPQDCRCSMRSSASMSVCLPTNLTARGKGLFLCRGSFRVHRTASGWLQHWRWHHRHSARGVHSAE